MIGGLKDWMYPNDLVFWMIRCLQTTWFRPTEDSRKDRFVTMKFMRKYVHIAKAITPKLTKDAASMLADEYAKLRSQVGLFVWLFYSVTWGVGN